MRGYGYNPSQGLTWCGRGLLVGLLVLGTGCENDNEEDVEEPRDVGAPVLLVKLASEQPPGEIGRLVVAQTRGGNRLQIRTQGGSHTALASGMMADVSCSAVRTDSQLTYFTVHPADGGTALLHAQLFLVPGEAGIGTDGGASECESVGEPLANQALVVSATGTAPAGGGGTTPDAGNDGGIDAGP